MHTPNRIEDTNGHELRLKRGTPKAASAHAFLLFLLTCFSHTVCVSHTVCFSSLTGVPTITAAAADATQECGAAHVTAHTRQGACYVIMCVRVCLCVEVSVCVLLIGILVFVLTQWCPHTHTHNHSQTQAALTLDASVLRLCQYIEVCTGLNLRLSTLPSSPHAHLVLRLTRCPRPLQHNQQQKQPHDQQQQEAQLDTQAKQHAAIDAGHEQSSSSGVAGFGGAPVTLALEGGMSLVEQVRGV